MQSEYQIDFLPTGRDSAICLRYGVPGDYRVMVYGGGTLETGKELVSHIREHYGANVVNDVVCSHPGAEHASDLSVVLQEMDVHTLWMHRPWAHAALSASCVGGRATAKSDRVAYFQKKMATTHALERAALERAALERAALERGIQVSEPFQGDRIGSFMVLSPSCDWYVRELMPELETAASAMPPVASEVAYLLRRTGLRGGIPQWPESCAMRKQRKENEADTETGNESSIVLFGLIAEQGILLTGHAGIKALTAAVNYAEGSGALIPSYLKCAQIPHRGRHNALPAALLDRLIGPSLPAALRQTKAVVFVSTPNGAHLGNAVADAVIRRGAQLVATQGRSKRHAWRFEQGDTGKSADITPFFCLLKQHQNCRKYLQSCMNERENYC